MNYKLLEKQDLEMMLNFIDDENTKYTIEDFKKFISDKNNYGFVAIYDNKIVGFATAYMFLKPDGRKVLYLDTIDVMSEYQGNGYGKKLISLACDFGKKIGCYKMFLITNKNNIAACKCYENAGGINKTKDDIVYSYDLM